MTRSLRARQAEILGIPGIPGSDRPWFGPALGILGEWLKHLRHGQHPCPGGAADDAHARPYEMEMEMEMEMEKVEMQVRRLGRAKVKETRYRSRLLRHRRSADQKRRKTKCRSIDKKAFDRRIESRWLARGDKRKTR